MRFSLAAASIADRSALAVADDRDAPAIDVLSLRQNLTAARTSSA